MTLHEVDLHGHRIRFRREGQGPVVVLLHGMAGSSELWAPVIPALARSATVVAPDLLGHGESAKPSTDYSLGALASHLRDLLVVLGHRRVTLVGHSLGGGIAMQFAYQFPERCQRLVLVSSGGLGPDVNPLLRILSVPGSELLLKLGCAQPFTNGAMTAASWLTRLPLPRAHRLAQIVRTYATLHDPETRSAFLKTLRSVVDAAGQRVNAADRLYLAAHIPTLIIWGERDRFIPAAHGHAAHAALPNSRLELMPDAGHFPQLHDPRRFSELLIEFMATTTPAAEVEDLARIIGRASAR